MAPTPCYQKSLMLLVLSCSSLLAQGLRAAPLGVNPGVDALQLSLERYRFDLDQVDLMPWADALYWAEYVSERLNATEKRGLVQGARFRAPELGPQKEHFTGNTGAIPRFTIPPLKMQDAGQGFRPTDPGEDGSVTSFPCLLAVASTWDDHLVYRTAVAIAEEFKGKGANVMLGPSVNVHRVAQNGRNFEYLSGEDPYLGKRLVTAFVRGVQGQGIMAVVKHFAFNEQETDRMTQDSEVDDRTAWELYYPPFEAAVNAGAVAVMCSRNKVNGTHACHNSNLLKRDLKGKMGFKGMVMSDWGAVQDVTAFDNGLDQYMPESGDTVPNLISASFLREARGREEAAALQTAALRVLTAIFRLRLHQQEGCTPPQCGAERRSSQRSEAHTAVARKAATSAVILLKNDGALLPLEPARAKTVAVLGPAADAKPSSAPGKPDYYAGGGSGHVPGAAVQTPRQAISTRAANLGISISSDPRGADVCVVIAATTAGEGMDRSTLELDGHSEIHRIAQQCSKTAVLMQTPGAVLTGWRHEVAAIANVFLAGEETAAAWAAVLFGDATPAGKLPISLPKTPGDTIPPSVKARVPYAEGLWTSYRSTSLKAAFPFGHGLSYTTFEYTEPKEKPGCPYFACVQVTVTNNGTRYAGQEVVQAYLSFPSAKVERPLMLRGFHKTALLQPGQSEPVLLRFDRRDVSIYHEDKGWVPQDSAVVHIGSSSTDLRAVVNLHAKL